MANEHRYRMRNEAQKALVRMGPEVVSFVLPLLGHEDYYVQKRALFVVTEVATQEHYGQIAQALRESTLTPATAGFSFSRAWIMVLKRLGWMFGRLSDLTLLNAFASIAMRVQRESYRFRPTEQETALMERWVSSTNHYYWQQMLSVYLLPAASQAIPVIEETPITEQTIPHIGLASHLAMRGTPDGFRTMWELYQINHGANQAWQQLQAKDGSRDHTHPHSHWRYWNEKHIAQDYLYPEMLDAILSPDVIPMMIECMEPPGQRGEHISEPVEGGSLSAVLGKGPLLAQLQARYAQLPFSKGSLAGLSRPYPIGDSLLQSMTKNIKRLHRRLAKQMAEEDVDAFESAHFSMLREILSGAIWGHRFVGLCAFVESWPHASRELATSYVREHVNMRRFPKDKAFEKRWKRLFSTL
jgi:hypothetical protein